MESKWHWIEIRREGLRMGKGIEGKEEDRSGEWKESRKMWGGGVRRYE